MLPNGFTRQHAFEAVPARSSGFLSIDVLWRKTEMPTPIPSLVPTGFQPVPEAARVNLPYGGVTRVRHGFPEGNDGISSASQLPAGCLRQKSVALHCTVILPICGKPSHELRPIQTTS